MNPTAASLNETFVQTLVDNAMNRISRAIRPTVTRVIEETYREVVNSLASNEEPSRTGRVLPEVISLEFVRNSQTTWDPKAQAEIDLPRAAGGSNGDVKQGDVVMLFQLGLQELDGSKSNDELNEEAKVKYSSFQGAARGLVLTTMESLMLGERDIPMPWKEVKKRQAMLSNLRLGEELFMKLERMIDPGRTSVGKAENHWASNYVFQVNYNNVLLKIRNSIMSPMNVIRILKNEQPVGDDAGAVAAGTVGDGEAVVAAAGEGEAGEGDQREVEYVGGNPEEFQDGETVGYNTWDEESDEEVNNTVLGKRRRSLSTSSEDCEEGSDSGESDEESEVEEGQS
ncbi:hypothetical protein ABG067_007958, partial [Albugo candida]